MMSIAAGASLVVAWEFAPAALGASLGLLFAYGASELLTARHALAKATANFLLLVLFDLPESGLVALFAMRADNAIRPKDGFEVFAGLVVVSKAALDFIQG